MIAAEATIWLGWAALAAGLALAFVCSGVETGTYVLNKIRLDLQAESGNRQALRLRGLLQRPEETLTVLLVMSNIANYVASAALVVVLTHSGWCNPEWAATAMLTPVLFVFCELLPKNLFHRYAEVFAYRLTGFLYWSRRLLAATGLVALIRWLMAGVLGAAGRRLGPGENPLSRGSHIAGILAEGRASGVLTFTQSLIAERVLNIRHVLLGQVMIGLDKAVLVSEEIAAPELREVLKAHGHPRVGVYSGRRENIIGVLNIFDVLLGDSEGQPSQFIQPALTLPADRTVTDALLELQRQRKTMAFVTDPSGAFVGMVTIKDLVEEIVGELEEF
jgi:putative hemolysin